MNELAIASVPMQSWEEPYDAQKALENGTMFPGLNKLFYVEEQMKPAHAGPKNGSERLLEEIGQASFLLVELTLYLDTHPDDAEARSLREVNRQKRKELMQRFASEYYPLTCDCEGCWQDGPAPWEGVC